MTIVLNTTATRVLGDLLPRYMGELFLGLRIILLGSILGPPILETLICVFEYWGRGIGILLAAATCSPGYFYLGCHSAFKPCR